MFDANFQKSWWNEMMWSSTFGIHKRIIIISKYASLCVVHFTQCQLGICWSESNSTTTVNANRKICKQRMWKITHFALEISWPNKNSVTQRKQVYAMHDATEFYMFQRSRCGNKNYNYIIIVAPHPSLCGINLDKFDKVMSKVMSRR